MKQTVNMIARSAGVSPATVSRVINGYEGVSADKQRKVLAVLEKSALPVRTRRVFRHGKSLGVLLLAGAEADPSVIVSKLSSLTERLPVKWNLQLFSPQIPPAELESRHLRGELSGLVLAGHGGCSPELTDVLTRVPHVWLNSYETEGRGKSVLMGNEFAGRIAARHLLAAGCRKTLVLSVPSLNPGFPARIDGFRFEFFSAGLCCSVATLVLPEKTVLENASDSCVEAALHVFLDGVTDWDGTGVFSPEDRLTALFYRAWCRRSDPLPRMVSCNHSPAYLTGLLPRPASIDLGARNLAGQALDELLRRIAGEPGRSDDVAVITTPQLIPGDDYEIYRKEFHP